MLHCGTKPIETPRLLLRSFEVGDGESMLDNWIADPGIQFEYGEPVYRTLEEVSVLLAQWIAQYKEPDFYRWAIIEKETAVCIGQIAFCRVYSEEKIAEIEYCIGRSRWGRGYANEALSALIGFAFEHTGLEMLEAFHREENRKSGRVLEKSQMRVTDTIQRFRIAGIRPEGEVCYCIAKNK
ncbi:MAG: GNAT family N-acetyltransferase [Clostridiales bacterium]|nr:GNAT family N-acetyltransferase [Clostridiales bacterium]